MARAHRAGSRSGRSGPVGQRDRPLPGRTRRPSCHAESNGASFRGSPGRNARQRA